jgi:tetratricopeptide (TPR) repeat protein
MLVLFAGCAGSNNKPPKAMPHYTLGLSFLQSDNPTMALREFLRALEENPKDPQVHAGLARAYQYKKAYPLAEQHYLKALAYSDNDPKYQNNLAALYLSMERWDQAIDYFQKASENLLFMQSEVALMGKGYAYYRKGDYPAALQSYREAESIAPRQATLHFHVGETYAALGQQDLAIAAYKKAVLYAPAYSEAHYQLAILLLKAQQIEEARDQFKIIVEQDPISDWGIKSNDFLKALK